MSIDLKIARSVQMQPIVDVAKKGSIPTDELEQYGKYKAKLPITLIDENKVKKSKLILVSAITPTPAGEGKTTTSIGLTDGLNKIGVNAMAALREPSLGPVFGIKGGAAGGGYAQVVPMEDINLHFNGDFAAIEKANNLLAALIDNQIQAKDPIVHIDPRTVRWKRVMDMNDRALRNIVVGMGGKSGGFMREDGFNITAASEVMAILCLSNDLQDLKRNLGNIFVGYTFDRQPVFARDIKADGAMTALLKDAVKPNLVQTLEHNPVLIHGGPFANIAQGTNTIIATKMAMSLADYVVTEAGFAFDLGGEKFLDIKCTKAGISPSAVVMVATIRALKYHGGQALADLTNPDVSALEKGFANLEKHLENASKFNLEPIVAINKFPTDAEEELLTLLNLCKDKGVKVAVSDVWAKGGDGATELATIVKEVVDNAKGEFKPMYNADMSIAEKVEAIAKNVYGADGVEFGAKAKTDMRVIERLGFDKFNVCIAKTQNSLSDNPKLLGRPTDFTINVREIEIAAGAGFVVPITGDIMRMPGLPNNPAAENIDINSDGEIEGLF